MLGEIISTLQYKLQDLRGTAGGYKGSEGSKGLEGLKASRISRLRKCGSEWFVLSVVAVVQKSEYGRSDSRK